MAELAREAEAMAAADAAAAAAAADDDTDAGGAVVEDPNASIFVKDEPCEVLSRVSRVERVHSYMRGPGEVLTPPCASLQMYVLRCSGCFRTLFVVVRLCVSLGQVWNEHSCQWTPAKVLNVHSAGHGAPLVTCRLDGPERQLHSMFATSPLIRKIADGTVGVKSPTAAK